MTTRSDELRAAAEGLVAGIPADIVPEVVVTGSVSRGVADEVSDVEMLLVTQELLDLATCFALAAAAGLEKLGSWGPQGPETSRVSGTFAGIPFELIWWSREYADAAITVESPAADAIANGVSLRTCGLLEIWQARLGDYPDELAAERIEDAALTWGGFAAAGLLTIARPGERLALVERLVDDAVRVLRMVYAINRTWLPTTKRVEQRAEALTLKPERLAERIEPYWRSLAGWAAELGPNVSICLELHPGTSIYNAESFHRLRQVTGPNILVNVDPSHFWWQGIDPLQAIDDLAGSIGYAHGKDTLLQPKNIARHGLLDFRWPSGPGSTPWHFAAVGTAHSQEEWRHLLDALRRADYDGVVSIEHEDPRYEPEAGVDASLEGLLAAMTPGLPAAV